MADCKSCLGAGYFCSNCEHPGRTCVCDDLERGSADEIDCEACDGLGYARSSEDDFEDDDYEEAEPERCGCRCGCPRSRLPFHQFCGMCSECCFNPPVEEP